MAESIAQEPVADRARPVFPTSAGMFLGLSLSCHLAAGVQAIFGNPATGATLFLVGQFALAMALLRLINGRWVFQDIRFFFSLILFLYGASLPLVVIIGGEPADGIAGAAFCYGLAFVGLNFVFWWTRRPWTDVSPTALDRVRPSFVSALLIVGVLVWVIAYGSTRGLRFTGTIDRSQMSWIYSQVWVVSMMVMNGFAMYIFAGWSKLSRKAKWLVGVAIALFVLLHISLGNRRDFLPMVLFAVGLAATRRRAVIRLSTMAWGLVAFALLTFLGVLRQVLQTPVLLLTDPVELLITQNEFVTPIQTLMYYVSADHLPRYGWTYFAAPALFIPRALWPGKPESISVQFMRDAFGSTAMMGYAYTPVTEAYLNFGYLGPFMVFTLLALGMSWLVKNANRHPGFYFLSFGMVLDFNRGNFGETLYPMVVMAASYWAMDIASRITWAPRRWRSAWPSESTSAHSPGLATGY
jgi:hypothetical protein